MTKERIYLTDITLHSRGHKQTASFSKVAKKGRMYSPLPKDYAQQSPVTNDGTFRIAIELPPDLQERINHGEAELMMPEGGLPVYVGRDVNELIEKMNRAKRRQLIHRGRTWHADGSGV